MNTQLRLALGKPHWRYKVIWLVLSLCLAAGGYALSFVDSPAAQGMIGIGLLSAAGAAAVLAWYALLVAVGHGARARVGPVDQNRVDRADKISVWLFSAIAFPVIGQVIALCSGVSFLVTLIPLGGVLAFFAVMRTLDITRESQPWAVTSRSFAGSGGQGHDRFDPFIADFDQERFDNTFTSGRLGTIGEVAPWSDNTRL